MTSSRVWTTQDAAHYDEHTPEPPPEMIEFLRELAGDSEALEFAVGTGRVALALAAQGVRVSGIELSEPMVSELRRKDASGSIPVVIGDMATTDVGCERFRLVYLVYNTLSNLLTEDEQAACFRNAHRHLVTGGRFVVELWVPPLDRLPAGENRYVSDFSDHHVGIDVYDRALQTCTSHHFNRVNDTNWEHASGEFRYLWPQQCDELAAQAGFQFESRFADWSQSPFTSNSDSHVSVWRKRAEI